jgi:hypothetical protein
MALDNYANLKAEIIDWSHRDDLDTRIDSFIDLAETEMLSNNIEPLRLRSGETLASFTTSTSTRFVALPTDYQSSRKLRIQIVNGESMSLRYRTPEQLNIKSSVGLPSFFTITDQIEFDRISDQAYSGEIQYYADFTALSTSNTTNSVLTNNPNVYLYGALWALRIFTEQPDSAANYYNMFISAIKGANLKDKMGRYGPAPEMRIEGSTP